MVQAGTEVIAVVDVSGSMGESADSVHTASSIFLLQELSVSQSY